MQPSTETKSDNRKTFRLDDEAAEKLAQLGRNHRTENAAINHVLIQWPKEIARHEQQKEKLRDELKEAQADTRRWREAHDKLREELAQIKNSLQLIGKLLNPPE